MSLLKLVAELRKGLIETKINMYGTKSAIL